VPLGARGVSPSLPVKATEDLIALLKSKPDNSITHLPFRHAAALTTEMFKSMAGLDVYTSRTRRRTSNR